MNSLICSFGGRKFFYCWYWGMIATALLMHKDISSVEWGLVIAYTFGGSAVANSMEAIQTIKANGRVNMVRESQPVAANDYEEDQERKKLESALIATNIISPGNKENYTITDLRSLYAAQGSNQ